MEAKEKIEKEFEGMMDVDEKDEKLEDKNCTKEVTGVNDSADNDEEEDEDEDDEDWESGDDDDDEENNDDDDDESDDEDEDEDEDDSDEENEESQVLSDSDDEGTENCPICLGKFKGQDIGTPESCDHTFCLECIQEWSKNVNTCPVDRQVYHLIIVKKPGEDKVYDRITVEDRNQQAEEEDEEVDETACEVCGHSDREDRLLLCDGCDLGYHCECLSPPLSEIPVEEWFCPDCANREGMAEVVDDNDEVRHIISENQPLTRRLRYQRRIARTRVSERVRARIQQHRAQRHGLWTSSEEEEDNEEDDEEDNEVEDECDTTETASSTLTKDTVSSSVQQSESTSTMIPSESQTSLVTDPSTSIASTSTTPKKKKTPKKRKKTGTKKKATKKRRKRKTKTKKKSATSRTKKRKTKKRKTKKKSKKAKRTSELKKVTSIKGRIATTLGLSKPPTGRTIPLQKKTGDKSLDEQRSEVGASSLSLLGSRNELIGFQDEDSQDMPAPTPTVKSKSYSTSKSGSKYSKSALLSHRPVKLTATVQRRKRSPSPESTAAGVSSVSQPPVGVHRGGPFDILGSIMHSQGKLHLHSKDVTIQRDGSLTSTKPIKPLPLSTNVERMGRITLSMPGCSVDRETLPKPTDNVMKKHSDIKPKSTSTSQFLASLMKKPNDSEHSMETEVQTKSNAEDAKKINLKDSDVSSLKSTNDESIKVSQSHTQESKPSKENDASKNTKESEDEAKMSSSASVKSPSKNTKPTNLEVESKMSVVNECLEDLDYIDDANISPPDSPCAELNLSDNEIEKNGHLKADDDKNDIDPDHLDLDNFPSPPDSPCAELNFSDNEGKETNSHKDQITDCSKIVELDKAPVTYDGTTHKLQTDEETIADERDSDVSMNINLIGNQTAAKKVNAADANDAPSKKERYADERDDPYTDSETEFDSEIISAWKSDSDKSNKKAKSLDLVINPKHTKKDASRDANKEVKTSVETVDDKSHKQLPQKSEADDKKKDDTHSHQVDSEDSMTGMEVVDEVGDNSDAYLDELDVSPVGSVCAELNDENTLEEELLNMEVPSPDGSPCAELNLSEGEITKEDQASDVGEIIEEPVAQYSPVIDAREVINKIIEEKTREKEKSQFSRRRSDRGSPRISIGQLLDGDVGKRSRRIYRKHRSSDKSSSSSSSNESGEEGEVKSRNGKDHKRRNRHRKHKRRSSDDEKNRDKRDSSSHKTPRKHKNIEPAEYSVSVLTRMDMLDSKQSRSDRDKRSDRHDRNDRHDRHDRHERHDRRDTDKVRSDDRGSSPVRVGDKHSRREKSDRDFHKNRERDLERDQRTSRFERERSERDVRMERNYRSEKEDRVERGHRSDRSERDQRSDRDQRQERQEWSHRSERHRSRDHRLEEELLPDLEVQSSERDHDRGHRKRRQRSNSSSSPYRSRSHHKDSSRERRRTPSREKDDHQRSKRKRRDKSSDRERPAIREKSPFWDHERGISPVDWNRSPVVSVEKSPEREVIVRRRRRVHIDDNTVADGSQSSKKKRKDKNKRDKRPRSPKSPPPPETVSPILLSDYDVEKEPAPKQKRKGRKKRKGKRKKGPPAPPGMLFKELEDDAILVGEIEHVEIEIPSDESEKETVTVSKVPNTSLTNATNGDELYDPLEMASPRSRSSSQAHSPRSPTSVRSKSPEKENHGNLSDDPSDYDPAHPTDDDFKLVKSPLLDSSKPSSPARVVIFSSPKDKTDQPCSTVQTASRNKETMLIEISNDKTKSSEAVSPEASPEPLTIDEPEQDKLSTPPAVSPQVCEPQSAPIITPTNPTPSPVISSTATVTQAKPSTSPIFPSTVTPATVTTSKPATTPVSVASSKPSVSPIFSSTPPVTTAKPSVSPIFPSPKSQDERILSAPPNKSPIAIVKPNEPIITSIVPPSSHPSVGLLPTPTSTANPPVGQVFPTLQTTDSPFTLPRPIPMSSTLTSIMNGSKMHVEPAPRPRSLLSLPFPPLTSNQTRPRFNQLAEINRLLNTQARLAGIRPDPKTGGVFKIPAPPVDHSETLEVVDMDIDKDSNDDVSSPSDDECELKLPQSPMPKRKGHKKRHDGGKDEMPSSAADLGKKQKYVKKLHLQERVIEEVKLAIKPFYSGKKITKEQYKEILRRAVPKVCHSKAKDVNPMKIKLLVEAYVAKFQKKNKKKSSEVSTTVTSGVVEEPGSKTVVTARWLKSINKFSAS